MAQLQITIVTGTVSLPQTENTSSVGNIWYDTSTNQVKYSYLSGGSILVGTL
jgi:hypothetical protein